MDMNLNNNRKLGKRLSSIVNLVTHDYDVIWDCCCDHGLLGTHLLFTQANTHIHFVDIVPKLVAQVTEKLTLLSSQQEVDASTWQTHCCSVIDIPISKFVNKQLIIIAGVGGDLCVEFVSALATQLADYEVDFLLCPVHHTYALRERLRDLNYSLRKEVLIEENDRFYEILLVSNQFDVASPISLVGEQIWNNEGAESLAIAKSYLAKTMKHYQRVALGKKTDVTHILSAYQQVKINA